ncbi:IclR family transcriptional regulator [Lysinibacter cavernae]|uniref:Glycerol operon regulatory protein n=1 Tax=Lysinibacter cavernae TaxID=1640652 RepID=A0A7X5TV58_9MICO|nr:IclR family transcriptional regulator [Lysinibacter cavernae]NIH54457.1 IclR family acetate operon transcriptional repressor [Lysinibacter cavernae]
MTNEKASGTGAQSVERVFWLLQLIAAAGGSITLTELANRADLPRPTIHRILRTLVADGYLRQLANKSYSLGPGLISLGEAASKQLGMVAHPQLNRLVDQLGESANMAILDGDMLLYIAQVGSKRSMRTITEVGRRSYMHDSGLGKALLSQLDDASVRGIVGRAGMPVHTDTTLPDADSLIGALNEIRATGYSTDEGEQEVGVRCFAVPIPNAPTPTAISVSGPAARLDDEFRDRALPLLFEAAASLSALTRRDG